MEQDKEFKKFLKELIKLQTVQVKYGYEASKTDNIKQRKLLTEISSSLKKIETNLSGITKLYTQPLEKAQQDNLTLTTAKDQKQNSLQKQNNENKNLPKQIALELSKELSKLSQFKVSENEKTIIENVKEGVAAYKQVGSAIASPLKAASKIGKNLINPDVSFKDKITDIKNKTIENLNTTKNTTKEIMTVGSDYSVEKERFGKEYDQQGRGSAKEGELQYKNIIAQEKNVKDIEKKIENSKQLGFNPKQEDIKQLKIERSKLQEIDNRKIGNKENNLNISEKRIDVEKEQLKTLNEIKDSLVSKTPAELPEQKITAKVSDEKPSDTQGISIPDAGLGKKVLGGIGSLGKGIAKFAGSTGGKLLGGAAALGLGAYTAYKGYTAAEEQKQASLQEIEAKVKSGEITPEQGEELKKQAADQATENKGGALGKGSGLAAGAIGGAVAGAKLGAFFGPAGVAVGGLAGGALGAFSGSKVGQNIGGAIGKGVAGIKGLFSKQDTKVASSDQTVSDAQSKAISEYQTSEKELAISKEKIRKFEEENPFDYREKPTRTQEFLGRPGTGKFKDPKKQAEYDKLVQDRESSLDKMDQAKEKYQVSDQTQEYKTTKSGNTSKNVGAPFKKLEALTGRMGYKKEEFLNDDGKTYNASKINAVYEKEMTRELSGKEKVETVPSSGAEVTAKKPDSSTGLTTGKISTENNDMTRELTSKSSTPTPVVTNSVNNNTTTSYIPMKTSPRTDAGGSALERYVSRVSAY